MTANQNQYLQWLLVPFYINHAYTFDTKEDLKLGKKTSHLLTAALWVKCKPLTPYVRPTGVHINPNKRSKQFFLSSLLPSFAGL